MPFGGAIKKLREDANISVQKIADRIGVDAERWRKWEQNDQNPRIEDTLVIEEFFGMDLAKIMDLTSIKKFLIVPQETKGLGTLWKEKKLGDVYSTYDPLTRTEISEMIHTNRLQAEAILNLSREISSNGTGSTSLPSQGEKKVQRNPVQQTNALDKPKIHSPRKRVKQKGILKNSDK